VIIETKTRSLAKGITWRITATLTTVILVYIFFGRLEMAAAVGGIEVFLKLFLYFLHERGWGLLKFGRRYVDPFVLWFTGLPCSGKSTIADLVFEDLSKTELSVERLDSKEVRRLFPHVGYTREERLHHLSRVAFLVSMLEKNRVSVVASFVSPYKEARENVRTMTNDNYVEVYVKASIETCKQRDCRGIFKKAEKGEIKNFTGISDVYEEPESPDILLDTEKFSARQCADQVLAYVNKKLIK
jgi:adenylylsulfate kinase